MFVAAVPALIIRSPSLKLALLAAKVLSPLYQAAIRCTPAGSAAVLIEAAVTPPEVRTLTGAPRSRPSI